MWFNRMIIAVKKYLHNVAERIKSTREGRTETQYEIVCDDGEVRLNWLTLENKSGTDSFRWDSVLAIHAYKKDLWSFDQIHIDLESRDYYFTVHEHMKGWNEFLNSVEAKFPGFPTQNDWITKIMIPAFARNYTTLWPLKEEEQKDCPPGAD